MEIVEQLRGSSGFTQYYMMPWVDTHYDEFNFKWKLIGNVNENKAKRFQNDNANRDNVFWLIGNGRKQIPK